MNDRKKILNLGYIVIGLIAIILFLLNHFVVPDSSPWKNIASNLVTELIGAFLIYLFISKALINEEWQLAEQVKRLINPHMRISQDRQQFDKELASGDDIRILGISLSNTTKTYQSLLQQRLDEGANIRVIVLKDSDELLKELSLRSDNNAPNPKRWKRNIKNTKELIRDMREYAKNNGTIKLRSVPYIPSFGLTLVNPTKKNGYCFVEIYHHKSRDVNPNFFVDPVENKPWFTYFVEQFELIWLSSDEEALHATSNSILESK
jgi:hypothetical protein